MNPCIPYHKVPRASIMSESEVQVSITDGSLCAMFTPLHSSVNQELFEKYACNQSSCYEKYNGAVCPSYRLKLKYPLPFSVSHV